MSASAEPGRSGHLLALFAASLLAGGCSPIAISIDYDSRVDFRHYRTFDWLDNRPRAPEAVMAAMSRDPFFSDSVREAVNGELSTRGLSEDQIAPDLLAIWHTGDGERIDVERFGYAYAAQYGAWGDAIDHRFHRAGTLVLDLIEAATMRLVWRGVASGAWDEEATPEETEDRVREAARKLLSSYPPAS